MATKRKIWVGPADAGNTHPLTVEGRADTVISPGFLVEQTATGLRASNNAATVFNSEAIVAMEYGNHTGQTVEVDYAVNDYAIAAIARSGEFLNVMVNAGNNITARGTALSSNGDGTLKIAATDGTEQILFYADEVINVTSDALVLCRKA